MAYDDGSEEWSTPCPECGSHYVKSYEVNDDDPEADVHLLYYCASCHEPR